MDKAGMLSPPAAIEIQGLAKSFGNHHALRGVDLSVAKGEHLIIFGPNGAGKTTLVKILATIARPSAGSVRLDGFSIFDEPVLTRHKIGLVSHHTFLYNNLTIYENLKFYGKMYGVPELEQQIHNVASLVRLESRLYDRAGTLSRGLQQRASIARAILHNPSVMLLDEPEVGLDPHAMIMIRNVLDAVNTTGHTVVMTTHNLERGLELGDRIAILDRGKIVYQANKREIDTLNFREIYDHYTGMSQ